MDYLGLIDDTVFSIEMNNTNVLSRNEMYVDRIKLSFEKVNEPIHNFSIIQLNINNFKIPDIEKSIVISEMSDGVFLRSKKMFVDVYLPILNEKYLIKGIDSMSLKERKILAMFIGKENIVYELSKGRYSDYYVYRKVKGFKR